MKEIGILGCGEVGSSIRELYQYKKFAFYVQDPRHNLEFPKGVKLDILHVAIPYHKGFLQAVMGVAMRKGYPLIINHSTVPVGTTKKLQEAGLHAVHSPVRGMHPNLFESIRTFVKYIGADNKQDGELVLEEFKQLGIPAKIVKDSKTTELGKLLDTTYYGLCIAFHQYAADLCYHEGVNFDIVMTDFNKTYNEGYAKDRPNVIRPILYPPNGKIGGHCVIPNAKILMEQYGLHDLLSWARENS